LNGADADTLRQMTDRFRARFTTGVVVLGSVVGERPMVVAAITDDLVKKGWNAGDLVKSVAAVVGGSGGGRPNLAQAGGKGPEKLAEAIDHEIRHILDTAYQRAKHIVREQKHAMEALADALLEHETIDRPQFEVLMT